MPHVSEIIDLPASDVYAFAADPRNLPRWAHGLGGEVQEGGDHWLVETPSGPARVTFAPPNPYGVLDHDVVTSTGVEVHVPLRVLRVDAGRSEVVLTVRPTPGMTDDELARDVDAVRADLALLKRVLEADVTT